ncbi:MAG: DUF4348 domain-containing protein [Bacteroidetes bacterium]|nr:DUF4348 domain-containing protein [Bacteroidota bacterium]
MSHSNSHLILFTFICYSIFNSSCRTRTDVNPEIEQFIFGFSQSPSTQINAVLFPLPVIQGKDTTYTNQTDWEYVDYCFGCEFSPILFAGDSIDNRKQFYIQNQQDEFLVSVYLIPENIRKTFYFAKESSEWFLTKIEIPEFRSTNSESIFDFLKKFSSDSSFIEGRIADGAMYCSQEDLGEDIQEHLLTLNELKNNEYIFRRIYIHEVNPIENQMVLYVQGEGTGYHLEYYFKRENGEWFVNKLVNFGV